MKPHLLLAASLSALLTACATPELAMDQSPTPLRASFEHATPEQAATVPATDWWRGFDDPLLDRLVAQALNANRDLLAAEADLKRARALAKLTAADGAPFGGVSLAAGREREGEFDIEGGFAAADANVSWEADIFGRIRANTAAAQADALSVAEAHRGLMTLIAAQVASAYTDLRASQARLAAAEANLTAQTETHRLTEALRAGGRATQLEVMRADTQLQATAALLPRLEAQIDADIAALDYLTAGLTPESKALLRTRGAAATPPPRLAVGSPDQLLSRRPDIRQAQARVQAATARVSAARVEWWPRLTFIGSAGLFGDDPGDWSSDNALSFVIGPRIDWPALDARRNALRLEAAKAGAEAEFLRYDQIVLGAVRDVETALSRLNAARRAEARSNIAAQSARRAADVSRIRYREGVDAFFNVLDSQRTLALADDNLAVARSELAQAYVALGQALGAGWSEAPPA